MSSHDVCDKKKLYSMARKKNEQNNIMPIVCLKQNSHANPG